LLRDQRHRPTIVPTTMRANGNFSDASLEWLHSVGGIGINRVTSTSDAFDPESPLVQTNSCLK